MFQKELVTMFYSKKEKKIQVAIFHCVERNANIARILLNSPYHMKRKLMGFQSEKWK